MACDRPRVRRGPPRRVASGPSKCLAGSVWVLGRMDHSWGLWIHETRLGLRTLADGHLDHEQRPPRSGMATATWSSSSWTRRRRNDAECMGLDSGLVRPGGVNGYPHTVDALLRRATSPGRHGVGPIARATDTHAPRPGSVHAPATDKQRPRMQPVGIWLGMHS